MNPFSRISSSRRLVAAAALCASSSFAATYSWDTNGASAGSGGSGTWDTTTANWDLTGTGADNGTDATQAATFVAGDTAQFGGTAGTVNFGGIATQAASVVFSTAGYTLQDTGTTTLSGQITLASGTTTIDLGSAGANAATTLTLSGKITGAGGALSLTGGAARNVTITGNNGNDYSGGTTLGSNVRLSLASSGKAGTGLLTVQSGAQLSSGVLTLSNNLVLAGTTWSGDTVATGDYGALRLSQSTTLGGSITLTADTRISAGGNSNVSGTFSGVIGGNFNLGLGATGTGVTKDNVLTFSGNNTYTGTTTLNTPGGGSITINLTGSNASSGYVVNTLTTLNVGGSGAASTGSILTSAAVTNNGTLAFNLTGNQTLSGVVSGTGTLIQKGTGTTTLSGVNTYTGQTQISGGNLTVAAGGRIVIQNAAGGVTLTGASTILEVDGALKLGGNQATIANGGIVNFALSGASIFIGNILDTGVSGNTYQLITGGTINNAANVAVDLTGSGVWSSAALDSGGLLTLTAVPEPSTYGLLGAGMLAGIALVRRRRKQA